MLEEDPEAAPDPEQTLEPADEPADEAGRRPAGASRQRTGGARRAALAEGLEEGTEGEGGAAEDMQEGADRVGGREGVEGSYAASLAQRMACPEEGHNADGAPSALAAGGWSGLRSVLVH